LRPSIANVVDIKAYLKIAELYDFINPSMPTLSKNQNSWKYAKTITNVTCRRINKSTVGPHFRWESERRAYGRAIIFSSVPNGECIFRWNDCLLRELLAWRNRKRTRIFPITMEWIYGSLLTQSSICCDLTHRITAPVICRLTDRLNRFHIDRHNTLETVNL